ncbi:hypothetical protein D3C80_1293710 [compost metagenome]
MQVLPRAATGVITGKPGRLILPGRQVQRLQAPAYPQTLASWELGVTSAQQQFTTPLHELVGRCGVGKACKVGVSSIESPLLALQAHAETAVAGVCCGFAEGRRQVDGQALQVRVDAQPVVPATQAELQLVRQLTGRWQSLFELQPVGECLERYLAIGVDARLHLPRLAFGSNLRRHRLAERLQADALAT